VEEDRVQATAWFCKAVEQGYAPAQRRLGQSYEYGLGIAQDVGQAKSWYRKAAKQGDVEAREYVKGLK
jgi:TPR repeat protein